MNIMFMGTPDISATVLCRIAEAGHTVTSVVTGVDKPRGRGNVMTPTPTKSAAQKLGIRVYEPATLKDGAFAEVLELEKPDIIVVVAYGKILPPYVLEYPKFGCVNLHVSLLPKYRGAAPMQRAIMNGDKETGVTVMYMAQGLDTGDIISSVAFPIEPTDNFENIHDKSAEIGAELLSRTLLDIEAGRATRTVQNEAEATYAAKVEKADCKIDFTASAEVLDCRIRGTTPIPGAFCMQGAKMLKITRAVPCKGSGAPGEVIDVCGTGDGYFTVACGDGALRVLGVIPEGKGRMSAGDFVRGRKIAVGDVLA